MRTIGATVILFSSLPVILGIAAGSEPGRGAYSHGPSHAGASPASVVAQAGGSSDVEVLTNESVVAMVRAGLPEGVILAKIRSGRHQFDLSSAALIRLKTEGIPGGILEAMLGNASPSQGSQPAPSPRMPYRDPSVASQRVYHVTETGMAALNNARSKLEFTHVVFFAKTELVIPGRQAAYRITQRQPVFHTDYPYAERMQLARFRIGGRDDRNLRVKSAHAYQFTATAGFDISDDDLVGLRVDPDPQGGFWIRLLAPLALGEYGFIAQLAGHGGLGGFIDVPEFGVD